MKCTDIVVSYRTFSDVPICLSARDNLVPSFCSIFFAVLVPQKSFTLSRMTLRQICCGFGSEARDLDANRNGIISNSIQAKGT